MLTYEESHKTINGVLYKKCSKCNEWFLCADEYFYKNKANLKDGLHPWCKKCTVEKSMKYASEHYDKHLEGIRKNNTRPEVKEKTRIANKVKREKGILLKWQHNNKDKIKDYANKRKHKKHSISKEEWNECKKYFNFSCAYCGISEENAKNQQGQYLHKEHFNHEGENDLSNCIPACKICNSCKNTKRVEDWYNEDNSIFSQERLDKIHKWLNEDYKKHKS